MEKAALLQQFGSIALFARASSQELLPFISRTKALQLIGSLRLASVALRAERRSLTIDSPETVADLCSEMRFLDRESLGVVFFVGLLPSLN
jgi:DNA repair protein RadC